MVDPTDLLRITEGNSGLKPSFRHRIHSFFRSFGKESSRSDFGERRFGPPPAH